MSSPGHAAPPPEPPRSAPASAAAPGVSTDPRRAAVDALQRGLQAAASGRGPQAIAAFRQALAHWPDFAPAQANLGLALASLGRHDEAVAPLRAALAQMPGEAPLHNALGVALEALGQWSPAEVALRAALAANERHPEAHANLANCLRKLRRFDDARAHYLRAIELQPDFALAHYNLGVLLQDHDELAAAIACYRTALALQPDTIEALNNLGSCLRKSGDLEGARIAFERVLELRPQQLEAHCNLVQLKTYRPGDPHVDHLLALRERLPGLTDDGRTRYWFAAGKMLEDIGRFDEAFDAYAQGNAIKHAITPWDEATHLELLGRLIATFDRAWIDESGAVATAAPMAGSARQANGPVPVFIVGMPRSGTTLLEQVLSSHPGVHGAGELTALSDTLVGAAKDLGERDFRFPESFLHCTAQFLLQLGDHYRSQLRALAPDASYVVDKLPANFMHVGLIHRMLPDARIIHARRDPMDSCFSCFSRLFVADNLGFAYDLQTIGRYWVGYIELMQHWQSVLPPGRLHEVAYEDMVSDFEAEARRLVDYLGLPWDDRCLGFHDNRRLVKTASVAQVRRPIYRTSVARWKSFEARLAPLLEIVGAHR